MADTRMPLPEGQTVPGARTNSAPLAGLSRRSLWLQEALAVGEEPATAALAEAITADICIVGGGYTGLWTALRVCELAPSASVVLLEADLCGGGASGRNGGFALSWWPKIKSLIARVGEAEALRLARASEAAIGEIGVFCARQGIDAHFRQAGWLWTATSRAQLDAWSTALALSDRLGARPFQPLDPAEVAARTGSALHLGGVLEASGATVQPALLARGLRRVALARGVRIFERTPMLSLDREQGVAHTVRGSVRAGAFVLATNAGLAGVPELRRRLLVVSSDIVATEPMPERLAESGWSGGESISDSRLMVHYYRTTRDGRVAFGRGGGALAFAGGVGHAFDHSFSRTQELTADMHRLLPATRGVRVSHAWGGAVDRSADGLPFAGRLPGRVPIFYAAGFSGNGVAPCLVLGRIQASLALERADEWSGSGLVDRLPGAFPPEPIRFLGGSMVRAAVARKEAREDRDQPVGLLTSRLARLVPSGFSRVAAKREH